MFRVISSFDWSVTFGLCQPVDIHFRQFIETFRFMDVRNASVDRGRQTSTWDGFHRCLSIIIGLDDAQFPGWLRLGDLHNRLFIRLLITDRVCIHCRLSMDIYLCGGLKSRSICKLSLLEVVTISGIGWRVTENCCLAIRSVVNVSVGWFVDSLSGRTIVLCVELRCALTLL